MSTLAKRRRLGVVGVLLLATSLVTVVGLPAWAHTPEISADCEGLKVDLTSYDTEGINEVTVTVDRDVVDQDLDFGADYSYTHPWDDSLDHTYVVVVKAHDDPNGDNGWTNTWQGSVKACSTTTTAGETTTTAGETTTTAGETTTTAGETTTTAGETTTTAGETTTTAGETTTTAGETTTTQSPTGVLGIQVSAPEAPQVNQVTLETLPFTGISTGSMALLAAAFAGVGVLLLLAARQNDERTPVRSWNS